MARKRFRRKRRRFRRKKRSSKRSRINTVIIRGPTVCPDKVLVKLKYSDNQLFTAANLTTLVYRGNGLFDPDQSGIGTQPYGFDQWAMFYQRYKVNAAKILIRIINESTTENAQVSCFPSTITTHPFAFVQQAVDAPYNKDRIVGPEGSSNIKYLTNYTTTKSIRGTEFIDEDFASQTTTVPGRQWFYLVLANNLDGSALRLRMQVTITYFCEFYKRLNIPVS